jgi:hypothetical protein
MPQDLNHRLDPPHPDDESEEKGQHCHRCGGLLLLTYYQDIHDDTGQFDITALRCAMCGEVVDPVILKNRRGPAPNLLYGTKARKFSQQVKDLTTNSKARRSDDGDVEDE